MTASQRSVLDVPAQWLSPEDITRENNSARLALGPELPNSYKSPTLLTVLDRYSWLTLMYMRGRAPPSACHVVFRRVHPP